MKNKVEKKKYVDELYASQSTKQNYVKKSYLANYDINEDDSIVKHLPPAGDSTLGPAYYKPQIVSIVHFTLTVGRPFMILHVLVKVTLIA